MVQSHVTGAVKVGRSKDVESRLESLQTGSPHRLKLLAFFKDRGDQEKIIHRMLKRYTLHMQGEWFHFDCLNEMPDWIYSQLPVDDRWWVVS